MAAVVEALITIMSGKLQVSRVVEAALSCRLFCVMRQQRHHKPCLTGGLASISVEEQSLELVDNAQARTS